MTTFNLQRYLKKQAQDANPVANPLDGMNNAKARLIVNRIIEPLTKSETGGTIMRDQDWRWITRIWQALNDANLDWNLTNNEYIKDKPGDVMPIAKQWKFEIRFTNNKGRPTVLYGVTTAHGAGTIEDPLSAYDITSYVS